MVAGRIGKPKKRSVTTAKAPSIAEPKLEGIEFKESSNIYKLFSNANSDGSLCGSSENIQLMNKLWLEIGKSTPLDIESLKMVRKQYLQNIALTVSKALG